MHVRTASLAAVVAALLAAPPARAQDSGCSGKLSGAVEGTFDCKVAIDKGGAAGKISFVITPAANVPGTRSFAPGDLELGGPLKTQTYTVRALDRANASLTTSAGAAFTATGGKHGKGEVTLNIAQAERYAQLRGRYVVNGSYQARLVPAAGAKEAEVVVDVQFTVATGVLD
jgi:hypothetical protein